MLTITKQCQTSTILLFLQYHSGFLVLGNCKYENVEWIPNPVWNINNSLGRLHLEMRFRSRWKMAFEVNKVLAVHLWETATRDLTYFLPNTCESQWSLAYRLLLSSSDTTLSVSISILSYARNNIAMKLVPCNRSSDTLASRRWRLFIADVRLLLIWRRCSFFRLVVIHFTMGCVITWFR